jgi:hypothetical protein
VGEQLSPEQQQEVLDELAGLLVRSLPGDWNQLFVTYRSIGSFVEPEESVVTVAGGSVQWTLPAEAHSHFLRLRYGMYRPDAGTWTTAKLHLVRPGRYGISYDGDGEPDFRGPVAAKYYREELELFPRPDSRVPAWLSDRAAQTLNAPVFDGEDENGRPIVDRPRVHPQERDRILAYLESAPVVVAARSHGRDVFDPSGAADVPMTVHSDGTWTWSGATGYYLRKYDLAPVAGLVEHIRRQNDNQVPAAGPATPEHEPRALTDDERRVLDKLRGLLAKCGVPEHEYGIVTLKPDAEVLQPVPDGDGWQIDFCDASRGPSQRPRVYATVTEASQAMLWMLASRVPEPVPVTVTAIESLPDEPPLSLLGGDRQRVDLPPGTEIDRYGGPSGNLVYAAGTSFPERSLPPDWINRPYYVYRVQRSVAAIGGLAVPWFDQPGGGQGYFLAQSVQSLVDDGSLVAVSRR